jgi:hypothetical protein
MILNLLAVLRPPRAADADTRRTESSLTLWSFFDTVMWRRSLASPMRAAGRHAS